jgi:hypothetical protein
MATFCGLILVFIGLWQAVQYSEAQSSEKVNFKLKTNESMLI